MKMECLIFDVYGDFAHYRKFYTTSSPLTFSIPTRTSLCGLISAIIGIDKSEYLKYFSKNEAKIAIKIIKPVKKMRMSYNLIDTKTAIDMHIIKNRTQVTFELLKDCGYRIYFSHNNKEIFSKLKDYLKDHKTYYTPCMGLSQFIADIKYVGAYNVWEKNNDSFVYIDSVIPFDEENLKVEFEDGKEYFKDVLPNEMNQEREVKEYIKVIYERNCKNIKCNLNRFYECEGGEKIVFL